MKKQTKAMPYLLIVLGLFFLSLFLFGSIETREAKAVTAPAAYGLNEGDVISSFASDGDPDVFIINNYGYKRLFLNPAIFGFYGHLGFAKVKAVTPAVKNAFITSGFFRNCEINDSKVFAVEVTGEDEGTFHHLNISGEAAAAEDNDFFNKVFCINIKEYGWYKRAAAYTALNQAPRYNRETPAAQPTPVPTATPTVTSTPTPALTATPVPTATVTPTPTPAANKPDLIVSIESIDRTAIVYGQTPWTWITYKVTNQGTAAASAPFYLRAINNGNPVSGYMTVDISLAAGASTTKTFAVGHDSVWPIGSYKVKLEVDYTGVVNESNETNNYSAEQAFTVTTENPDLTVTIDSIDNTSIVYGKTPWTWVTYHITNAGTKSVTGPIYLRVLNNGIVKSGYMTVDGTLEPGASSASKTFAVGHDSAWPVGSYKIKLEVDYPNSFTETNEANNYSNELTFTVTQDNPDLTVSIESIDNTNIVYGKTPWTWVHYKVTNNGTVAATAPFYLQIISNGSPKSGYMTIDSSLSAGASVTKTFAVGHDTAWPVGSYTIKLEADYTKIVAETNETNNYSNELSFVVANENPDLTVTIDSIDNTSIVYGKTPWTWITYHVDNIGSKATAGPVYLRSINNGVPMSGYMTIADPIAAGASSASQKFAVGHDSVWPAGSYNVKLEVDYQGLVAETNEANNYSNVQAFTVVPNNPDLTVSITGIDKTTIVYGQSPWTWVTYKVTNSGTNTANAPIYLRIIKNGTPSSGYMTVDSSLAAGASTTKTFAVGHDSVWPVGSYTIKLEVDYPGSIAETNETNNYSNEQSFTVVNQNPDITVSITSIDRTSIVYGQSPWTWVHYKVTNNGTVAANAPFYLRVLNNGTPRSGYMTVSSSLAPGASVTNSFAVGHDSAWPAGSYNIKLEADYTGVVTETNEANNYSNEQAFTVTAL